MMVVANPSPPPVLWWLPALRQPEAALGWTLPQWEHVVRVARRLRLLGRLAESVEAAGLRERMPAPARRHLVAEMRLSRWQTGVMVWGLHRVADELGDAPYPRVLLKGAAYVGQGLPIARGRLPSDLDILVPRAGIADAQARLQRAGWQEPELDAHDQRFYHAWSHEVPPMQHASLPLELDLHHNILPPVGHVPIDMGLLLDRLQPSQWPGWQVLHPQDQILHSAAHLFFDAELRDRLRDLVDLDGLLRHFAVDDAFWPALQQRAGRLGLTEPLLLALQLCRDWLQTPVPQAALDVARSAGLSASTRAWLLPLLTRVLLPVDPDRADPPGRTVAAAILLARHHRRRLPLRLLVPHVWHKLQVTLHPDAR
jgi:hypothetical protein